MASQTGSATPASSSRKNSLPSLFSVAVTKRLSNRLTKPNRSRKSLLASAVHTPTSSSAESKTKALQSSVSSNVIELPPAHRYRSFGEILSSSGRSIASVLPSRTPRINGLAIASPQISSLSTAIGIEGPLPKTDSLREGAVLGGDVALFGSGIPAKIYKLLGTAHLGGVKELVQLTGDVALKELLPGFAGEIMLADVSLVYRAEIAGQEAGVWLRASTRFEGALEGVGNAACAVFGLKTARADVSGYLGQERDWKKPLRPKRFSMQSVLGGDTQVDRRICFNKIGVEVSGARDGRRTAYDVLIHMFGEVLLTLPGSGQHLKMEWTMKEETPGMLTLKVDKCKEEVVGMVGYKGLRISDLRLVASFSVAKPIQEITFDFEATMAFGNGTLLFKGVYSESEFWVEAKVPKCTLVDIQALYTSMTGRELEPFDHSVELEDIACRIDANGLQFRGQITVDGHRSVSGTISIKRDGVAITGVLQNIKLGHVTVEKAALDIFLGRPTKNETSRESGFAITGKVSFHDIDIDVAVYLTVTEHQGVQWTVYGELTGNVMRLQRLAPEVKDTWLDLELKQMAFIASNIDSPQGDYNDFDYPIRSGVQFCATIEPVQPLNHVTKTNVRELALHAVWSPDTGFNFGLILPTPIGIHLTKKITSGPVSVEIGLSPMPHIQVTAELNVTPTRQSQPLVFRFGLKADIIGAQGFGEMNNYWVNPLGISEKVKIGPTIALELGINYATLAATGTPSFIGFSAGMAIGDVEAQVAMAISENPGDELIKASLTKLSVQDLVKFASEISGQELALPPQDLLGFRDVLLYLSTGVTIGTTHYPSGATMKGEMDLFGQSTDLECTIGATTRIAAQFGELEVGPLIVSGSNGGGPSAVIELGVSKQHILIDGAVKIMDLEASVRFVCDILPSPGMELSLRLAFADALEINLDAKLIGIADFKNLSGADFMVHAVVEQDILQYLARQIRHYLSALLVLLQKGIEAAQYFIDEAQEGIESAIELASSALESAKSVWDETEAAVDAVLDELQDDFQRGLESLELNLFTTQQEAEDAIFEAGKELEQAKMISATTIAATITVVRKKKAEMRKGITTKLQEIREVKEKTKAKFGALEEKIKHIEEKVKHAQIWYDTCSAHFQAAEQTVEDAPFYRKIDLSLPVHRWRQVRDDALAELTILKLQLSQAITSSQSPEYNELRARKAAMKDDLRQTRMISEKTIADAEADLEAERKVQEALVNYHEAKVVKEAVAGSQNNIKEKERAMQRFKEERETAVQEALARKEALAQSRERELLDAARDEFKKATIAKVDVAAAKSAIEKIPTTISADWLETLVDGIDDVLDIKRVEVSGSLRDLVQHGKPLKAEITMVVAGKEMVFALDYGVADAVGFVGGVLEGAWDAVCEVFDGEE